MRPPDNYLYLFFFCHKYTNKISYHKILRLKNCYFFIFYPFSRQNIMIIYIFETKTLQ
nr:MAG TPA: hypothetical protein [Caudoviricetes sp.]